MELSLKGKLIMILPTVEGESSRGHWIRGGFVIETEGDYPKKVAFSVFGEDRVNKIQNIPEGTNLSVSFDIDCHEFNEKWYTSLRAYSIVQDFVPQPQETPSAAPHASATNTQNERPRAEYPYAQQAIPTPSYPQMMEEDPGLPF